MDHLAQRCGICAASTWRLGSRCLLGGWPIELSHHAIVACAQDAVTSGGPLLTVLGFLILPLIWSVPEALITAELATAFPENSGYVAWVTAAFGPFWGFQVCSNDMWLAGGLQTFATPWTSQLIAATLLFAGGMAELDFRRH